jgi:hypothetical protein
VSPDPGYASYLLRLRRVQNESQATWVASVQSTATGEQRSFPSIEALATFLLANYHCRVGLSDENSGSAGESKAAPKGE